MTTNEPITCPWTRGYISIDRSLFDVFNLDESPDFSAAIRKASKVKGQSIIIELNTKPWRTEKCRPYCNPFRPTWLWPAEISGSQQKVEIRPLID